MDERRSDLISLAAPAAVPLSSPTQAEGLVHHTAFSLGARRGRAKEEAFRMRAVPVRYWLIGLVLLLVVPLATVSSLVFARFADHQRAAAERQLIETTRALAIATEWHVLQSIRQLQLLSPRDGPARSSEQAASAITRGEFLEVAFFDETGRLVASQPYMA